MKLVFVQLQCANFGSRAANFVGKHPLNSCYRRAPPGVAVPEICLALQYVNVTLAFFITPSLSESCALSQPFLRAWLKHSEVKFFSGEVANPLVDCFRRLYLLLFDEQLQTIVAVSQAENTGII